MLVPAIIFLMILFPVLLPASLTAVDAIARAYRRNRTPGYSRSEERRVGKECW